MSDLTVRERHNVEAEAIILGSAMLDSDLIADLATVVNDGDFYDKRHASIWNAILRLHDAGQPTTNVAVAADLAADGTLDRVGGRAYLRDLVSQADGSAALFYAQTVAEDAGARRMASYHLKGLQEAAPGSGVSLQEMLANAQSGLDTASDERTSNDVVKIGSIFEDVVGEITELEEHGGQVTGLSTGFADLDAKTAGLHPGQMITIAARPGGGKSTLGLDLARAVAIHQNEPAAVFSLEMSRSEITMKLISAEARVELAKIRGGNMGEDDWNRVARKTPDILDAPLFIDDTANITMRDIKTKCRRIQQRHGLKLVIIDYLQLMTTGGRVESRQQEVAQISRECKLLAKELGVTVVVMSQLNRGPENRQDKRPQVSDLRESGAIEQDSDAVILIYREEVGNPDSTRIGEADFIIGKQRNGPAPCTVTVASQLHVSRFWDMARDG